MYEYNKGEVEHFSKEGGAYLLREGVIDTNDIEEIRRFRRGEIEEEEEENVRKSNKFNIVKLKEERSDMMFDNYELKDLVEEFLDEEIDEDFEKELKIIPEKLKNALQESYKILNEFKEEIKDLSPELFSAIGLLARIATGKPGPSKYPYPEKKVKKSMPWSQVQDLLFGGHLPGADDGELEKSSKENPFPSITRAIKIKKEVIDEIEEEMEEDE